MLSRSSIERGAFYEVPLVHALLTFLAMCLERLYRLRYLRRGTHAPYSAIEFVRIFWLNLGRPEGYDTS